MRSCDLLLRAYKASPFCSNCLRTNFSLFLKLNITLLIPGITACIWSHIHEKYSKLFIFLISLVTSPCFAIFRCTDSSNSILILLASWQQTCTTYTIAVCTVKNSWWRTEELSETCRVLFQNKNFWEISASSWLYNEKVIIHVLFRCTGRNFQI